MSGITAVCVVQIPDEKLIHAVKAIVVAKNKNKDRLKIEVKNQQKKIYLFFDYF